MPRTPKSLEIRQITSSGITTFSYVVPAATITSPNLVITNAAATINDITVIINDGTDDFTLAKRKLPAGIGKTWRVLEMSDQKLDTGFTIKLNLTDAGPVIYFLSGSEFTSD